ncbi:hypothetical protein JR316_0001545 [Psilocybe cubensis]|uniref:Uncharacterized protein n=2 Tax=Psilocybe cubensis TaxID=181762 RepID=A0ACB8HI56_PSICU|nr:hypothetical protein JR316_0001545 [Psilocybe cubensis]KAH9487469.1 hypothetical protein JR316_0001545 [Psilocybe cubensis]
MPSASAEKSVRFSLDDVDLEDENDDMEETDGEGVSTPLQSPPPITPTPSPTFSESTLDSSIGPLTPPPGHPFPGPSGSRHFSVREPSALNTSAMPKLNPVLVSAHPMQWDMNEKPDKLISLLRDNGGDDPVGTLPSGEPIRQMQVVHDDLADWPLLISDTEELKVKQVLLAIHNHLQKKVTGESYHSRKRSEQMSISERYRERALSIPIGSPEVGLRRIDFLPGRMYVGLKVKSGTDGHWDFILSVTNQE